MMKNNSLYIVLGIGAGVLAYYLFCKNKKSEVIESADVEEKPVNSESGSSKVSQGVQMIAPNLKPKYVTPVATTTPLVVNVTTTPSTTTTATATTPSKVDITPVVSSVTKPTSETITTKPATTTEIKPTSTTTATTEIRPTTTTTAIKSSFEGIGSQCFEVGQCLTDL